MVWYVIFPKLPAAFHIPPEPGNLAVVDMRKMRNATDETRNIGVESNANINPNHNPIPHIYSAICPSHPAFHILPQPVVVASDCVQRLADDSQNRKLKIIPTVKRQKLHLSQLISVNALKYRRL